MIHSRYLSSQSLNFKRDDFRTDSIPSSSLDLEGHISTVNDASIKQADWDVSKLRDKRCRDIEVQAGSISNEKLSELIAKYEVTYLGFYGSHGYLASSSLMLLLKGLRAAVIGFELDKSAFDEMVQNLRAYARSVPEPEIKLDSGRLRGCVEFVIALEFAGLEFKLEAENV
ncbi:hypothetical protein AgCh_008641 [Apium graveolens]